MRTSRSIDEPGIGALIGTAIKSTRIECGWSQRQLADRVGTTQSEISRLESGRAKHLDVTMASRTLVLLGVRIRLDTDTLGLAGRREQRDLVHAACASYLARRLGPYGWVTSLEVEIGAGRFRGWIDVLAFRSADRSLLVGEIKTQIRDVGEVQRAVGWYEREAWQAAGRLGWRPRAVSAVLILLASDENDARAAANRGALKASFPASGTDLARWITTPGDQMPGGGIAMVDPRSRRAAWLMSTRSDGRRSPAAFTDYRDAAAALTRR